MKFSVFQLSRIGGRRKNEDRMGYCYTRESGLFVLADGMGGHPEGDVAAQLALFAASAHYQNVAHPVVADPLQFLSEALHKAHEEIGQYAQSKGMDDSPRTTLVAALVQDGCLTWVHCGDSRLYVVRDGALLVRTRDHSYLEQQNTGLLRPEHLNRNILFACLGSSSAPVFETGGPLLLQRGDKILLCSDGLWGSLAEEDILASLSAQDVSKAVPELVERALVRGGRRSDNVTALAMEWETPDTLAPVMDSLAFSAVAHGFTSSLPMPLEFKKG